MDGQQGAVLKTATLHGEDRCWMEPKQQQHTSFVKGLAPAVREIGSRVSKSEKVMRPVCPSLGWDPHKHMLEGIMHEIWGRLSH